MIFTPVTLAGAYLIEPEPISDERGFFARTYCRNEFAEMGLNPNLVQCVMNVLMQDLTPHVRDGAK